MPAPPVKAPNKLDIKARLTWAPSMTGDAVQYPESGNARVYVNVHAGVQCSVDPSLVVDLNAEGVGDMHLKAVLCEPPPPNASVHFCLLLRTVSDGVPCWFKSGTAVLALSRFIPNVEMDTQLMESSDPTAARGILRVRTLRNDSTPLAARPSGCGLCITTEDARTLIRRSLDVFYQRSPMFSWMRLVHTPYFDAVPGGFYALTLPHVASPAETWKSVLEAGLERGDMTREAFVGAITKQRETGSNATELATPDILNAAVCLGYALTAVPTAYTYMSDHRRPRSGGGGASECEQFWSGTRVTGADDCEGLGHESLLMHAELVHGPGRMDGPPSAWGDPLLDAAAWLAAHFVVGLATWGVTNAALQGGGSGSGGGGGGGDVMCHINAIAIPRARFHAMGKGVQWTRRSEAWETHMRPLMLEGTGCLHPDILVSRDVVRASVEAQRVVEERVPEMKALSPVIVASALPDGAAGLPFFLGLVSAYVPGEAAGVVEYWFGRPNQVYGLTPYQFATCDGIVGPTLTCSPEAYGQCMEYVRGAHVPPALQPPRRDRGALDAAMTHGAEVRRALGIPPAVPSAHVDYIFRVEYLPAAKSVLSKLAPHLRGARVAVQPLARDVTTVHVRLWPDM